MMCLSLPWGGYNLSRYKMINPFQLSSYKQLTGVDEKYNYYFTNDINGKDITKDSLFYQSYLQFEERLTAEIKSKQYNTLILLVGFSIQPLVLSINILKPKKVYLLFSNETKPNCYRIMNWTNKFYKLRGDKKESIEFVDCNSWDNNNCKYLINSSDPDDTYKNILDIVNKGKNDGPIAIDITGGKKTMVSGAFIAASMTGTDALYVDFGDYDGNNPVPGTEYIKLQKNPIDILLQGLKKIFTEISQNGRISQYVLQSSRDYKNIYPLLIEYEILPMKVEITPKDIFHTDFQND